MGHNEKKGDVDAHSKSLSSWRKNKEIRERKECNINVVRIELDLFSEGKRNPRRQQNAWTNSIWS